MVGFGPSPLESFLWNWGALPPRTVISKFLRPKVSQRSEPAEQRTAPQTTRCPRCRCMRIARTLSQPPPATYLEASETNGLFVPVTLAGGQVSALRYRSLS